MSLTDRVLETVRTYGMVPPRARVLVALSGGPDSVALLHLLHELQRAGHLTVAGVAHFHHGLRAAADDDEAFCRQLAAAAGFEFRTERADVAQLARGWRTSLEDAGRRARYAFLERAAAALKADVVATGHTRDDQAETYLLQLIRGAGPRGLSSIRPVAGKVCRPLLAIGRAELRSWLSDRKIAFRDDESNLDRGFRRNRVRHELIPYLEREFSPGIVHVLSREAAIARDDDDYLRRQAIEVWGSVVLGGREAAGDRIELDSASLTSLPAALGSRVAMMALTRMAPDRFIGFEHVERLLRLARGEGGRSISLPGQQARREGARVVLSRGGGAFFANSFRVPLSIPGEVRLEQQGWTVSADVGADSGAPASAEEARGLTVQVQGLELPLAVRSRRHGDRFRPAGGRRTKLQDFFVNRKVPREMRDSVPLVVDREDRIVWVVGQSLAEDFRVTEPSQGVLLLKARRLGGPG